MIKKSKTKRHRTGTRTGKTRSGAPGVNRERGGARNPFTGTRDYSELERRIRERTAELRTHQIELEMQNEELRSAQQELTVSRAKYADLFDFAPIGYFSLDAHALIKEVNNAGAALLGAARKQLLLNRPFSLFMADNEERTRFFSYQKEIFMTQVRRSCEVRMRRTDGTVFDAHLQSIAVENVDGKAAFIRTTVIDITERKQAEEALAAAHRQIQSIIDNTPDLVYALDREERFVLVNSALAALLNSTQELIIGKRRHQLMPKEDADWHEANDRKVIEAGKALEFEEYSRLKGRSITWLTKKFPLHDSEGRIYAVAGISADITELRRTTEKISRQNIILDGIRRMLTAALEFGTEEELGRECLTIAEKLTQSSFGFIGEIGPDGLLHDIALSDPGWESCTMYDKTGHRRIPANFKLHGLYSQVLLNREPFFTNAPASHPASIDLPKGHPHLTAFLGVPLLHQDKIIGLIAVANKQGGYSAEDGELLKNVSFVVVQAFMKKRSEQEIKELNQELARNVAQLKAANAELEAFIYSVSHDLRAPLRSIGGFSDYLLQDYADKLDERGKGFLDRVTAGAEKMNLIIDDLLRLSRISRQEINRQQIDISQIAAAIITELREAEPGRRVQVDIKEGISAYADKNLLKAALSNLLANAWKFSSKTENPQIEFDSFLKHGTTVYYVRDNGAGFVQEYADKLFLPFHRLHSDQEFEGSGIGLAIVARVICRHGGEIWAEGKPGKGAAFYFTL